MEREKYHKTAVIVGEPKIGKGTWVGPFTLLDGSGDLEIGSNCDISAGVHIYTHSSAKRCVANKKFNEDGTINRDIIERKPVKIGDNAFIGANSTIMMGVTIGKQCIIGSGAIVTKDIPEKSVAMGTPAKVIAKVHIDEKGDVQIQKLEK